MNKGVHHLADELHNSITSSKKTLSLAINQLCLKSKYPVYLLIL